MPRPHIEPFFEHDAPWMLGPLPGFPKGLRSKVLSVDPGTGACSLKLRYQPGFALPGGRSDSDAELFVLAGAVRIGDRVHGPGSYLFVPAGVVLPPLTSPKGAQLLHFFNDGEPSFVASDSDHPNAERERLTMVDAFDGVPWGPDPSRPAAAPGCLVKVLREDPLTGGATFLCGLAPNFRQDNVAFRDCSEEWYQISGTCWTMQSGNLPAGSYAWRPPYVNLGPVASPHGALALVRIDGERCNHFHFNPWTTPAENRERARAEMERRRPGLHAASADGAHDRAAGGRRRAPPRRTRS